MKRIILTVLFIFQIAYSLLAQVSYKDVAGIFHSRCTSCHHEGGAGPFPLMTYSQTILQTTDITDALTDGSMPPWSPDTSYTRFLHERIITDSEKTAILNWINNGAFAGDTTLAPTPPVYSAYQLYGTPSLELQIPAFTSNATSVDSYICFSLPTNLTQDRYLRAFEVIPGNPSIVHHVILNVDTLGTTVNDLSGSCYTIPGDYSIGGFAPGAPPTVFPGQAPMKLGILIKAGSNIVLQIHYPAGSAGFVDSTKLRMYFYPVNETGIRPVAVVTPLENWSMIFLPDSTSTYSASFPPFPIDLTILATFPHSHLLCRSIVNYAYSGTDTIPLIRINDWDFEWQGYYNYRYPVKIPAGYTLQGEHFYDNTSNNPNNPFSPPQVVFAGLSTTDEMFFDSFQLTYYLPGDEFVDIAAILATDSLLSGIPGPDLSIQEDPFTVFAFPNPSRGSIGFRISGSNKRVSINIFSPQGKLLASEFCDNYVAGNCIVEWNGFSDGKKVSPGIYLYEISSNGKSKSGKLIIVPEK